MMTEEKVNHTTGLSLLILIVIMFIAFIIKVIGWEGILLFFTAGVVGVLVLLTGVFVINSIFDTFLK